MPLTDTAIRALKPKATRYSRTDERGLVLEVFPTGGMLWHYRYRLNGKQERVTLGRYPALSLKLARAERDKRETLVAQGQSPAVQKQLAKQGAAPDTTVAEFGERFFRDVTNEDVRAIIWKKKGEGFDAAAGNIRSVLKRPFNYAQTAGLVDTNPVLALPMRHVHKAKARERALAGGSEREVEHGRRQAAALSVRPMSRRHGCQPSPSRQFSMPPAASQRCSRRSAMIGSGGTISRATRAARNRSRTSDAWIVVTPGCAAQ